MMNKKIKDVLKRINRGGLTSQVCLGELLSGTILVSRAIFVDAQGRVFVLSSTDNKKKNTLDAGLLLTELMATIKDLEASHLVYICKEKKESPTLFYSEKSCFSSTQFDDRFDIGDGLMLIVNDDDVCIKKGRDLLLEGDILPEVLGKVVGQYLLSIVYPTEGLNDYIGRGFQTEEMKRMKCANRISIIGIIIAIIVAGTSPLLSVWWSNSHGKSTINKDQFDQLLNQIRGRQTKETVSSGVPSFFYHTDHPFMFQTPEKEEKK